MSTSPVTVIDTSDAEARLEALRQKIGDVDLLKRRGAAYELDAVETALFDELRDLEFLLDRA